MATFEAILDQIRNDLHALRAHSAPDAPMGLLVENFFLSFCRLGVMLEQDQAMLDRPEFAVFFQRLEPGIRDNRVFLVSYPQQVIAQYQTTWDGGEWEQLCRRCSAIQFFVDLTRGTPIAEAISGIEVEIEDLDDHLRRWGDKEGGFEEADPGIPASHWWWVYPPP